MSAIFLPSLQHIAIAKIAIAVCNNSDVKALVEKLECPLCILPLDRWQPTLRQTISTIVSSRILQEKIFGFIRPISLEIERWKEDHFRILDTDIDLQNEFRWKSEGTIDRRSTAMALIRNENIDIRYRFALASFYCFDGEIPTLWQKVRATPNIRIACRSEIVRLWILLAKRGNWDDIRASDVTRTTWLEKAKTDRNAEALRYLLENLPDTYVIVFLLRVARSSSVSIDVMRFCLSFEDWDQLPFCKANVRPALLCILNRPSPSQFVSIANQMWSALSPKDFLILLHFILYERVIPGWTDCNYVELLRQFWEDSPPHFKEFVMLCKFSHLLLKTINSEFSQSAPSNRTSYGILQDQGVSYKLNRNRCLDFASGMYSVTDKMGHFLLNYTS